MVLQLHSVLSAKKAKEAKEAEAELMAVEVAPAVVAPAAAVEQLLLVLVASANDDGRATRVDAGCSRLSAEPATQSLAL